MQILPTPEKQLVQDALARVDARHEHKCNVDTKIHVTLLANILVQLLETDPEDLEDIESLWSDIAYHGKKQVERVAKEREKAGEQNASANTKADTSKSG